MAQGGFRNTHNAALRKSSETGYRATPPLHGRALYRTRAQPHIDRSRPAATHMDADAHWPSKIYRSWIEAQQHAGAAHVEIANLIDFICDGNRFAQEGHQRVITICDLDDHGLMPGMLVE